MSKSFRPYAKEHQNVSGPGDARPTAMQIIKDNNLIGKWSGRTCLVTGGTSGIGPETARALHATGADVFITARDLAKAKEVVEEIRSKSDGNGKLEIIEMEMRSLKSVKAAAQEFLARSKQLHVLVNNAGE
jgi:NAD(P)-dependent dehydrogenase (short-subunit alcohol dehydrogenase family)